MSFTEGSIGGDIERIDLDALRDFYSSNDHLAGARPSTLADLEPPKPWISDVVKNDGSGDDEPRGSNGIAIAPKLTSDGGTLLLINPHTSFYFRSELQMSSDRGSRRLWRCDLGSILSLSGFQPPYRVMHTSSGVDNVDEFSEKVERKGKGYCYWFGSTCRPLQQRIITIRYRTNEGHLASRRFTALMTHRGPIVASKNGRWIAFAMMNQPVKRFSKVIFGPRPAISNPSCSCRIAKRTARTTRSLPMTRAKLPFLRPNSCRGVIIGSTIPVRSTAAIPSPTGTVSIRSTVPNTTIRPMAGLQQQ